MPWAIGPWASQSMLPCRRKMSPNQRQLISAADSNPHGTNQNASVRLAVLADSLYNLGGIGGGPRGTDFRLFRAREARHNRPWAAAPPPLRQKGRPRTVLRGWGVWDPGRAGALPAP